MHYSPRYIGTDVKSDGDDDDDDDDDDDVCSVKVSMIKV